MRILIHIVLLCLSLVSQSSQAYEEYIYLNPFNNEKFVSLSKATQQVVLNDLAYKAYYCTKYDQFKCVTSDVFNFSIPREWPISKKKWKINDKEYRVITEKIIYLLGRTFPVLMIEGTQENFVFHYLYSKSNGLLGFKIEKGNEMGSFYSVNECGFASQKNCFGLKESGQDNSLKK